MTRSTQNIANGGIVLSVAHMPARSASRDAIRHHITPARKIGMARKICLTLQGHNQE
jgi:hypothetical protein